MHDEYSWQPEIIDGSAEMSNRDMWKYLIIIIIVLAVIYYIYTMGKQHADAAMLWYSGMMAQLSQATSKTK